MPDRAVAVETTVAAPFAAVWRALREPDEIRRWHGWDDPGLDAEIDVIYFQGVAADEAAGTLAIADGSRFELDDRGDTTVVRVTMPAPARSWDEVYDSVREGWVTFVHQLRLALEDHPGEERRALRLDRDPAEQLPGEVRHDEPHQLVRTVDAYGPGLVARHANGMVVATAYGDGAAALDRG